MKVLERRQLDRSYRNGQFDRRSRRRADYLAVLAGIAAALAALAGFLPGLYRDPDFVVAQSHGYDLGNVLVALVLELALVWAMRGSSRARLIAIGALGCLLYSFISYAFEVVLNPATLLYIAVLGLGGWSFVLGFAQVEDEAIETLVKGRLARRTTAAFLAILAVLFGVNWLSQIAGSVMSGKLPAELAASGWPMNPVYVLDLGFVLPLALSAAIRLARADSGGARLAVPLLVFATLLAASILLMTAFAAFAGQPLDAAMVAIFVVLLCVSGTLASLALRRTRAVGRSWMS